MMRPLLVATLFMLVGCAHKNHPSLPVVDTVELDRYAGTWYEIARYENRFEKGCIGATATYTVRDDGNLGVLNRCYDADGVLTDSADGIAKVTPKSGNAKLRVSFFWPFFGDYHVIMLADDYRYSVIGEPSRRYFWILAREPHLSETDKAAILSRMPEFGYTPAELYWTSYSNDGVKGR